MAIDKNYVRGECAGRFAKWSIDLIEHKAVPVVVIGGIVDGPLTGNVVVLNSQGKPIHEVILMLEDILKQIKSQQHTLDIGG